MADTVAMVAAQGPKRWAPGPEARAAEPSTQRAWQADSIRPTLESPEPHDDSFDPEAALNQDASIVRVRIATASQKVGRVTTLAACARGALISMVTPVESAGSCGRSQQKKP